MRKIMKALSILLLGVVLLAPANSLISKFIQQKAGIVLLMGDRAGGTGFHFKTQSNSIYIITNAHVCGDNKTLIASQGEVGKVVKVIKKSKKFDLCIVEPLLQDGITDLSDNDMYTPVVTAGHGALSVVTSNFGFYSIMLWSHNLYPLIL